MVQDTTSVEIFGITSERSLLAASVALGALCVPALSSEETALVRTAHSLPDNQIQQLRRKLLAGQDPLGDAFTTLRTPEHRRTLGATYTPKGIVRAMLDWATRFQAGGPHPERIIDPGVGSARFLIAAGRRFPKAELVGIEVDPIAALIARANLAACGFQNRSQIILGDYREFTPPPVRGKTLFIGNPPYVRHHQISPKWKSWLTEKANELGYEASQLAGLHVHFFLATALYASRQDFGCFITASEWLDVNYGRLVRQLFLNELGGQSLTVVEPTARPFSDAATTALISTFQIGTKPKKVRLRRVDDVQHLESLQSGRMLHRGRLESETRWSHLTRPSKSPPAGFVELGELCRVHRGQVTGANKVWIAGKHSEGLPPQVLFRTVTKARELFQADGVLSDGTGLRQVIDLPIDLSGFHGKDKRAIELFLKFARTAGAPEGYVAQNRKAWWSVGLKSAAPILATYMARRPPAFVRNLVDARHINIAHGIYPRDPLEGEILDRLARYLSNATTIHEGRTYAGGLTKFEPREMERLLVPSPELLAQAE